MPASLIVLLLATVQFDVPPPLPSEIQARAALDGASEARRRVLHALCGDDSRERRLREADVRLATLRTTYRTRFRRNWDSALETGLRQWECTLPDGFEWTLASYNNAITVVDAALTR